MKSDTFSSRMKADPRMSPKRVSTILRCCPVLSLTVLISFCGMGHWGRTSSNASSTLPAATSFMNASASARVSAGVVSGAAPALQPKTSSKADRHRIFFIFACSQLCRNACSGTVLSLSPGDEVAVAEAGLAVDEGLAFEAGDGTTGGSEHGVAGSRVPFHGGADARVDVGGAAGHEAELER